VMKESDLTRADPEQKRAAKLEAQIHSQLDSPYVVRHEASFVTAACVWICMEYCPAGSLWDLVAHRRANFAALGFWPEEQVLWWFAQLAQALAHVHARGVVHLDLKPANLLLARDWSLRLCDFGLSVLTADLVKRVHNKDAFAGTPAYASPEQMMGQPAEQSTDVWAAGVILYMLCALIPPFGDITARGGPVAGKMGNEEARQFGDLRKRILQGGFEPLPPHFSPELNALLARLLAKKARFRPTMKEVLAMPLLQKYLHAPAATADDAPLPRAAAPQARDQA